MCSSDLIVDGSGHVIKSLHANNQLNRARFSPDGRLVATASFDDPENPETWSLQIWDWRRDIVLHTISGGWVVDFDPTGSRIVTLDRQGRGEIVDVESERQVALLAGQLQDINDVAFSPDGALVATAGSDGAVRLFDAETGVQRLALPRQPCRVGDVAFSADGTRLASASPCDGVRIWALDIDDLLQIARQKVTR